MSHHPGGVGKYLAGRRRPANSESHGTDKGHLGSLMRCEFISSDLAAQLPPGSLFAARRFPPKSIQHLSGWEATNGSLRMGDCPEVVAGCSNRNPEMRSPLGIRFWSQSPDMA